MAIWQEIHPPSSNPLRLQDGTAPPRYQRRETLLFLQPKSLRSRRQSQPPPRPIDQQEGPGVSGQARSTRPAGSEERRLGKVCFGNCRYWWSHVHKKKKKKKK